MSYDLRCPICKSKNVIQEYHQTYGGGTVYYTCTDCRYSHEESNWYDYNKYFTTGRYKVNE